MAKDNSFFEDAAKMFGSVLSVGMNSAVETKRQMEEWLQEAVEKILAKSNVVRRDEFEALRESVQRLDAENVALREESAKKPKKPRAAKPD
jgi:polyhydroxyalkanoate synthesis regulator phasin